MSGSGGSRTTVEWGTGQWVERAFATQLDARSADDREALVDLLVVATDV